MNVDVISQSKVVRVDIKPNYEAGPATAYAIGDTLGTAGGEGNDAGKIPIPVAVRGANLCGVLQSLCLFDEDGQMPALDIFFFDRKPEGDYPDNAAFPGLADGDDGEGKLLGSVQIEAADWVQAPAGASAVVTKAGLSILLKLVGSTTLYATIHTRSACTWTLNTPGQLVMMVGILL